MFREAISKIKEVKKDLKATESGLLEIREARDLLTSQISNAKARLKRKSSDSFASKLAANILTAMKKDELPKKKLIVEINDALNRKGTTEFNKPVYKSALYLAAEDKNIYELSLMGAGWGTTLSALVALEKSGGTLTDYARGIRTYRSAVLKTKVGDAGSNRGLKATNWWRKNVYGTDKYERTIENRIGYSGRAAPFWQLLNSGSTPMASDRPDGSFNPIPQLPTGFIVDAEDAIKNTFKTKFLAEKLLWEKETIEYKKQIEIAEKIRNSVTKDIHSLGVEYRKNEKIFNRLGKMKKYADKNILADVARRLRAGEEFENTTIDLTKEGARGRAVITLLNLEGIMEY